MGSQDGGSGGVPRTLNLIPLVTLVTAGDRRRCEKERDRIQLRAGDDPDPGDPFYFQFSDPQ